jgi:putative nucleotidyltransferase with HDIG domain
MRLATRTFCWSFVPIALLLIIGSWATRITLSNAIRQALRVEARNNQRAITQERAKVEARMSRILRGVGVNATLAAAVEGLLAEHRDPESARRKVEQQLTEAATYLGFDALTVFDSAGIPRAAVLRTSGSITPLDPGTVNLTRTGLLTERGQLYELSSVGISRGTQVLGTLAVGDRFDLSGFAIPLVLLRNGGVLQSSANGADVRRIETALSVCDPEKECEIRLRGETYLSVPLLSGALEDAVAQGYSLRTLQSVDSGAAPLLMAMRNLLIAAGASLLISAFVLSVLSSRSIVGPISKIVQHLRAAEKTGVLPNFQPDVSRIHEIRELAERFNYAGAAIGEGRENLVRAYVEFTGSLASALDARDPYTAGHSRRVSDYACAIARNMNLPDEEIEVIRIGALLHDIGKIGIPDELLRKPGRLTASEMAVLREHPVIGRHILEGVQGFQRYLDIVELHHESWDGSGYPHGLKGKQTPLSARIVKVADAYDAMTSDRPYRPGMSHVQALEEFRAMTGVHIDPAVIAAFEMIKMDEMGPQEEPTKALTMNSLLHSLGQAVREEEAFDNATPARDFETNPDREPLLIVPMDKLADDLGERDEAASEDTTLVPPSGSVAADREQEPPQVTPVHSLPHVNGEALESLNPVLAFDTDGMDREKESPQATPVNALLHNLDQAVRVKETFKSLISVPPRRTTLQVINDQLKSKGYKALLKEGNGYFYFSSGETMDWLERTVRVPALSSLSSEQWLEEFERLKQLNRQALTSASSK